MSQLELIARRSWIEWGDGYALWGRCSCCREMRHVRGKRRTWMLCLECFDLVGPHTRPVTHTVRASNGREQA